MAEKFSVSGQHYLFDVQAFAHTVLSIGGDAYEYSIRDTTTNGVIEDVSRGNSELGVIMQTSATEAAINDALAKAGLRFVEVVESRPRVALPKSHPLVNAGSLKLDQLADYPYIYFEQEPDTGIAFAEEALADVPRKKIIGATDRATLSELIMALNGYTVTSGILVGITDGSALATVPLDTEVTLHLGYVVREGEELGPIAQKFVEHLEKNLALYAD
jgi:DNA-binding transcriptional LysR family regulator